MKNIYPALEAKNGLFRGKEKIIIIRIGKVPIIITQVHPYITPVNAR